MDSNVDNEHEKQPLLCANNCGFFGNPQTSNLCSQCYRGSNKKRKEIEETIELTKDDCTEEPLLKLQKIEFVSAKTVLDNTSKLKEQEYGSGLPDQQIQQTQQSQHTESKIAIDAPSSDNLHKSSSEKQTISDPFKCYQCKKKIGLTAIQCRCGFKFCDKHRYSDQHNCPVDYKTLGKKQLEEKNPKIIGAKLQFKI